MIKVLEHGITHRIARCPNCGCRFEYARFDISEIPPFSYLKCPECLALKHEEDFRDE